MNLHLHSERVFCEVCLKDVPRSEATLSETRDHVIYFCGASCYAKWMTENAARATAASADPAPEPQAEIQSGHGRSKATDDRLKRALRQHPSRDEPRIDEPEE